MLMTSLPVHHDHPVFLLVISIPVFMLITSKSFHYHHHSYV